MTLSESLQKQAPPPSQSIAQLLPGRLYFTSYAGLIPKNDAKNAYVDIEEQIHYDPFYDDFGPVNLSVLYRFCQSINALLQAQRPNRRIFLYTSMMNQNRVNAAYLIASYLIIYHNLTAEQAFLRVQSAEPPAFIGFRDAALGPPSYLLHVQHVIQGIEKGLKFKWLDFEEFDPDEYEYFERVENGDLNWIIPGKILSFCGPHDRSYVENGYPYHAPETYFDYFRTKNVTSIIRLNKKIYDAKKFTDAGFEHHDLFFIDGSTPSDEIVLRFIDVVDKSKGAVAIHCKAGLGRTGTLIACWMMKQFRLTAPQCMGWLRVCRPGSVIGPQQHFLIEKQQWCWRLGRDEKSEEATAATAGIDGSKYQNGEMSKEIWNAKKTLESDETIIDEAGRSQGDRLCQIKATRQQRLTQNRPSDQPQPSPPSFILPRESTTTVKEKDGAGARYSSATTPIKQLKLMSTKTTAGGRNRMAANFTSTTNPSLMNQQTKPAMELLKTLRTSSNLGERPMMGEMMDPILAAKRGEYSSLAAEGGKRRITTKIPIQKVSVSTNNNSSSSMMRGIGGGGGLHRKHFSSSRLMKPYLSTTAGGGHFQFDERPIAQNNAHQLDGKIVGGGGGESGSSATTSFGRALNRQYARINANSAGGQPSSPSSSQIQQQNEQQFNSPIEGPLAHHTNCKYELRPRNQLHLPSRFDGGNETTRAFGHHQMNKKANSNQRSISPNAAFPLSRHYKATQSSASFFSRL